MKIDVQKDPDGTRRFMLELTAAESEAAFWSMQYYPRQRLIAGLASGVRKDELRALRSYISFCLMHSAEIEEYAQRVHNRRTRTSKFDMDHGIDVAEKLKRRRALGDSPLAKEHDEKAALFRILDRMAKKELEIDDASK